MADSKIRTANKQIKTITYIGMAVNFGLSVIKVTAGSLAGSLALIADGVHSLSDLTTDAAVILGVRFGSKKADRSHPYGHGRIETFAGGFVAIVLIFVGSAMIYYATLAIARDEISSANIAIPAVALVSIISKEWLYRATKKVAVTSHSVSLYANAWHHRSDALSSIAVILGFVTLKFNFVHGDQVAAIAVGLMIIWVGVKIISGTLRELTDSAIDSDTISQIENIINADCDIRHWHKLRTRTVGRELFLDVHILVDPQLNIAAAHEISENLEKAIDEQIDRPVNITVHIEPDKPELRR